MFNKFGISLPKSSKRLKELGPTNDIQRDIAALDVPNKEKYEETRSFSFRSLLNHIKSNWVDIKSLKEKS